MRGLGVTAALADLPDALALPFAVLTQLGDLWFLSLAVALAYWLDARAPVLGSGLDRRRTAMVVALLCSVLTVGATTKLLLALERPVLAGPPPGTAALPGWADGPYAALAAADGYGFPSGHALGSTIVWGGLARAVHVGRARTRAAVAAAVVVLVSLSRLVLGVHFLVDVLAGAALGLAVLAVALRALRTPIAVLAAATAVGLVGLVLGTAGVLAGGLHRELVAAFGVCAGATAARAAIGDAVDDPPAPAPSATRGTVSLGLVLGIPPLAAAGLLPMPTPATLLLAGFGGAVLFAAPVLGERVAAGANDAATET